MCSFAACWRDGQRVWSVYHDAQSGMSTGKTVVVFTRLRAPYVNPDRFRFTIYRRGLFSDIA